MEGFIFGFVDNAVLIFGAVTGLEIEKYFKGSGVRGAVFGAAFGNSISDGLVCVLDPALQPMIYGVVLGTLVPILAIPFLSKRFK